MKEFFKDYKEMCIDSQRMWMKKHWKGYILMYAILYAGMYAYLNKNQIKEKIESKKTHKEES